MTQFIKKDAPDKPTEPKPQAAKPQKKVDLTGGEKKTEKVSFAQQVSMMIG